MAACPSCNAPADPLDRFCGRCGTGLAGIAPVGNEIARYCAGCGRALHADARFCRKCGARAPELQSPAEAPNGHDRQTIAQEVGRIAASSATATGKPAEAVTQRMSLGRRPESREPASGSPTATATLERPPVPRRLPQEDQPPAARTGTPEIGVARPAGFPWGGTLALIGSLTVIISAVLDWGGPFRSTLPRDISATWLLEPSGLVSGPSLGIVMLLAGTLGALVSLIGMAAPSFTFLRRIAGLLTLMIPMAFAFRTMQLGEGASVTELPSILGVGAIVAASGALLELAAGRTRGARRA